MNMFYVYGLEALKLDTILSYVYVIGIEYSL